MYSYQVASTVASDGYHVWYQGALDSMETYQVLLLDLSDPYLVFLMME